MPQASDEQRMLMTKWFGDIDTRGPWKFLKARGWVDNRGHIEPPVEAHTPSVYEFECIWFLCDEWDYTYSGATYQL